MDAETIKTWEREIEQALAGVVGRLVGRGQPPSQRTLHLMAKAAVAVYEATEAVRERPGRER